MNQPTRDKRSRRWRFTLRTLLILLTAFLVWLGWLANRAHHQREAVRAVREYGGGVHYDFDNLNTATPEASPHPEWLVNLIGVDFFHSVAAVRLHAKATERLSRDRIDEQRTSLAKFEGAPGVHFAELCGVEATDEAIEEIAKWRDLETLAICEEGISASPGAAERLSCPQISERGFSSLRGHSQLREIYAYFTRLGDDGLATIAQIPKLRKVFIQGRRCEFTDEGLRQVAKQKHLVSLVLPAGQNATQFTDAGIAHLHDLDYLEELTLQGERISDASLLVLSELPKLKTLTIASDAITAEGQKQFAVRSKATLTILPFTDWRDVVRQAVAHVSESPVSEVEDRATLAGLGVDDTLKRQIITGLETSHFRFDPSRGNAFVERASAREFTIGELGDLLRESVD